MANGTKAIVILQAMRRGFDYSVKTSGKFSTRLLECYATRRILLQENILVSNSIYSNWEITFMKRLKYTPIGIVERFQSWNGQLFKISPPKRWKLQLPISRPLLLLGVGMIAVVFVQGATEYKKRSQLCRMNT